MICIWRKHVGSGLHHTCRGGCCQWRKATGVLKTISLCCTTSSFCLWCSGSTWAVACWRVEEVWWREALSQGRNCKIVSFVSYYTWADSSISILSTSATVFVSFFTTKSETLPWFCHATSGTKQEGWEWNNIMCMYLLIMVSWLLYVHHSLKHLPLSIPWWTKISTPSQIERKWQELYCKTFKYISAIDS